MLYEDLLNDKALFDKASPVRFQKDIKEICAPLINLGVHNINYLEYDRHRKNFITVTNNPEYPKIYLENNGMLFDPYLSVKNELAPGLYTNIWHAGFQTPQSKNFVAQLNKFNYLRDGCAIVRNLENGKRVIYHFSSYTLNAITCYEALKVFTHYFEDKISPLLSKAEHIVLPNENIFRKTILVKNTYSEEKNNIYKFLKKINFAYYKCMFVAKQYRLSLRENQCLYLIIQGKINKQIAYELQLSQRTIECYIDNIKLKLNCRNKMELIIKTLTAIPW